MPIISGHYLLKMPVVDVLLATFNGGKFLAQQLDSILDQESVAVRLLVSDDGSTDNSIEILEEYRERFPFFQLIHGPMKGPAENFYGLLSFSTSEFVAFADQDDVWEPSHLIESIRLLKMDVPCLVFSNVNILTEENHAILARSLEKLPDPKNRFFENPAKGCTIVMNRSLVTQMITKLPKKSIMHDYWAYLVATCVGEVVFKKAPSVNYRLHDSNFIGIKPKLNARRFRNFLNKDWKIDLQLKELFELHCNQIHADLKYELSKILEALSGDNIKGALLLSLSKTRYRISSIDELFLRVQFIRVGILKTKKVRRIFESQTK
jgi:glycosyltransferase involved in cell wall biosynthesis